MDGVPTLLKICIDPIPYTLCHILLPSFYLYLIAHFYYFDLLIFDYLNGRACIARLMFELFESLLESEQMRGDWYFNFNLLFESLVESEQTFLIMSSPIIHINFFAMSFI